MNVIGIDVSKDTLDIFLDKNGKKSQHLKVSNDVSGCIKIHEWIKQNKIRKIAIFMEATGIYYKVVANYFADIYTVYVVNPLKISEYAKSNFVKTKTDKADCALIADYGKRHFDKLHKYEKPADKNEELQNLNALYKQLKAQIIQTKNRLNIATDEYIQAVLTDLLNTLQNKATETMSRIDKIITQSEYKSHYQNLKTIVGVDKTTAAMLLNYLTSKRFKNVNKFIAFAGLNPEIKESGTSVRYKERTTRYGHRRLKSIFYMPALSAFRSPIFAKFVERLIKKGKPKMVVIVALMRKLAKIAYSVFQRNEPFRLGL